MAGLSPRWLGQVLKDRGVLPPSDAACSAFVASLDAQGLAQVRATLNSIVQGVESSSDMAYLLNAIEHAHQQAVAPVAMAETHVPSVQPSHPANKAQPVVVDPPAKQPRATPAEDRPWVRDLGIHVYAGKAAMKVELDVLRAQEDEPVRYTVQLELAPAKNVRSYDWQRKIAFQFTRKELPLLGAMLLGYAGDTFVLTNHGPDHDKRLEIHQQGNSLFVKLRQGAKTLALPVDAADVYAWMAIVMTALKKNHEVLDSGAFLEMLKRTGTMYQSSTTQ